MPHTSQMLPTTTTMVRPQLQPLPRAGRDLGGSHPSSMAPVGPKGGDNLPKSLLRLGQTARLVSVPKTA